MLPLQVAISGDGIVFLAQNIVYKWCVSGSLVKLVSFWCCWWKLWGEVYLVEMGWFVRVELVFAWKSSDRIGGGGVVGYRKGCCAVGGGLVSVLERRNRFLYVESGNFAD
jgi:hypothetical protein